MSATSPSANDCCGKGLNCLVIGIPESARVAGFLDAAAAAGWPPCAVASWRDVLAESWEPPASLFTQPFEFGVRGACSRFEEGGLPPPRDPPQNPRITPRNAGRGTSPAGESGDKSPQSKGSAGSFPETAGSLWETMPRLVRLESPGRNWPTEQLLLELGADESDSDDPGGCFDWLTRAQLAEMSEPAGRIVAMRQWYLGWRSALLRLENQLPGAVFLNPPRDIAILFDKAACQMRLEAGGCPTPPGLGIPQNADDLLAMMEKSGRRRVFLKACHGSSASAVIALERSPTAGIQAFSTVEIASLRGQTLIFNRRPGAWTRGWAEVRPLLDAVCRQRALAQVWVPKAGWRGKTMDLRIVTIAGRARHTVVRLSRSPLTNLQLRNVRGDTEAFSAEKPAWNRAARLAAEKAAACFPDCLTLGVDVALSPDGRAWVLEVNAFGDHLPGCLHEGLEPWAWQIRELTARFAK